MSWGTPPQVPGGQTHCLWWSTIQRGRQRLGGSEKTHEEGRGEVCFTELKVDDGETTDRTEVKQGGTPVSTVTFSELADGSAAES